MVDGKTLNALDGESVLKEVMAEKTEAQRRSYKTAIKNAVVWNDKYQEIVSKAMVRAKKNQAKLDTLVEGGLEGFLDGDEDGIIQLEKPLDDDDDDVIGSIPKKIYKRPSRYSKS